MTGTVPAAISSGTSVAVAVPNTISSTSTAIGIAISSPRRRSASNTGCRSWLIATCPLTYTRPPPTAPIARRIGSTRSAAGWGSRRVPISANETPGPAGWSGPTRASGRTPAARCSAAACAAGAIAAREHDRVARVGALRRSDRRASVSARSLSVPGRSKRFESRSLSFVPNAPVTAASESTAAISQAAATA